MRHDTRLEFFPHRDACPYDGRNCKKQACRLWLGESRCWSVEFGILTDEYLDVEKEGNSAGYYHFKDSEGNYCDGFHMMSVHFGADRDKPEEPMIAKSVLMFNSERLAEKVKEKFGLSDWEVESRNEDGGDDHALIKKFDASPAQIENIRAFFQYLINLIPQLIAFEKEINVCQLCKKKSWSLEEYNGHAVCFVCVGRIITENIDKYFKDDIERKIDKLESIL